VRRVFFALLFANLAYFAWALWVTPPPTVPANAALARLPPLKLVDELPPERRPDPNAAPPQDKTAQCSSIGPFADVNSSAQAAALLKEKGFEAKQRAAEGDSTDGFWVFVGPFETQAETDKALASLEHNGVKDALVMPATADTGRRVSLGLFTERARADRRAQSLRAMGLSAQVADRKLPNTLYWVDLTPPPGMTSVPLQDLFAQGVSSKVSVQPCPPPVAAVAAQNTPPPASPAAAGTPVPVSVPKPL
jgi:hypothetical protein